MGIWYLYVYLYIYLHFIYIPGNISTYTIGDLNIYLSAAPIQYFESFNEIS